MGCSRGGVTGRLARSLTPGRYIILYRAAGPAGFNGSRLPSVGLAGPVGKRQGDDLYALVHQLRHLIAGGGAAYVALRCFLD